MKKDSNLHIRLPEEEKAALVRLAKAASMSPSELARVAIRSHLAQVKALAERFEAGEKSILDTCG